MTCDFVLPSSVWWWGYEVTMSFLKSTPSDFPKWKVPCKTKPTVNLGSKMPYLSILG